MLIDAFNRGFNGELDELVGDIVAKSNGQRDGLNSFINELRSAGCLTDSQPKNRFIGEDDGVIGTVNFSEVIIATPTSLICQGGKYQRQLTVAKTLFRWCRSILRQALHRHRLAC